MINKWFISDTHFGHKNILEFEKKARPFSCLEEMHEVMIDRWNAVVRQNDIVYHLGDFSFGLRYLSIANLLHGKKKLVMGNHDTLSSHEYLNYFDKLYGVIAHKKCVLSHVPVHPNCLGDRFILNVHGHLHSKNVMWNNQPIITEQETGVIIVPPQYNENYFNVSCEQNNLTPFHWDQIEERLNKLL